MKNIGKIKAILAASLVIQIVTACSDQTADNLAKITTIASILEKDVSANYDNEDYYFDWKSQGYETIDISSNVSAITKSGIYEITGTAKDGSITVNVDKSTDSGIVYLVLNNANISSSTTAPIHIKDAEKVVLVLENGTTNTISQGSSITINDKDELKITDGTIYINSKADGIVGKDILAVKKALITIIAGKDGMRSTNDKDGNMGNVVITDGTFNITSNNDSIQAYGLLKIDGGTFNIISGGGYIGVTRQGNDLVHGGRSDAHGQFPTEQTVDDISAETDTESQKGLKSIGKLIINNGTFTISSTDDSIHSAGKVSINGGTIDIQSGDDAIHSDTDVTINNGDITVANCYEAVEGKNITVTGGEIDTISNDDAFNVNDSAGILKLSGGNILVNSGGDGIDSNSTIEMSGGTVYVSGPTNDGNGSVDYQVSFSITGGTLVAAGSSGMAQAPESGTQSSVLMYYNTAQSAGTVITLKDSGGNTVVTYTPEKEFSSAVISSPDLKTGQNYTLYSNDTKVVTFTLSDTTTYLNESGITEKQSGVGRMPGGNGGQRGGFTGERPAHPDGTPSTDVLGSLGINQDIK